MSSIAAMGLVLIDLVIHTPVSLSTFRKGSLQYLVWLFWLKPPNHRSVWIELSWFTFTAGCCNTNFLLLSFHKPWKPLWLSVFSPSCVLPKEFTIEGYPRYIISCFHSMSIPSIRMGIPHLRSRFVSVSSNASCTSFTLRVKVPLLMVKCFCVWTI